MSRFLKVGATLAMAALLAACGSSDQEELQQWMASQRANTKPRVTPLTAPKDFTPQAYLGRESTILLVLASSRRPCVGTPTKRPLMRH